MNEYTPILIILCIVSIGMALFYMLLHNHQKGKAELHEKRIEELINEIRHVNNRASDLGKRLFDLQVSIGDYTPNPDEKIPEWVVKKDEPKTDNQ